MRTFGTFFSHVVHSSLAHLMFQSTALNSILVRRVSVPRGSRSNLSFQQQVLPNGARLVLWSCHSFGSYLQTLSLLDSTFVATLFTSDAEKIMRYTDEGETTELCKWTVDLSSLPSFRNNAAMQPGGFYTGEAPTDRDPTGAIRLIISGFI